MLSTFSQYFMTLSATENLAEKMVHLFGDTIPSWLTAVYFISILFGFCFKVLYYFVKALYLSQPLEYLFDKQKDKRYRHKIPEIRDDECLKHIHIEQSCGYHTAAVLKNREQRNYKHRKP